MCVKHRATKKNALRANKKEERKKVFIDLEIETIKPVTQIPPSLRPPASAVRQIVELLKRSEIAIIRLCERSNAESQKDESNGKMAQLRIHDTPPNAYMFPNASLERESDYPCSAKAAFGIDVSN